MRGHTQKELLEIMEDGCSYEFHRAIISNWVDEENNKNKKR